MKPTAATKPTTRKLHGAPSKSTSSMMHFRIDDRLRRDATATLESIGLFVPDAVRLFLHRVVVEQALPLRMNVPNRATERAMKEAMESDLEVFNSAAEFFGDLEKGGV